MITEFQKADDKGSNVHDDQFLNCKTIFYTAPPVRSSRIYKELLNLASELTLGKIGYRSLKKQEEFNGLEELVRLQPRNYEIDLIIIDEVDRLNYKTLEIIRDIYDQLDIGVVLIGMPGIEKRLSRYPQLYSRIGFSHQFEKLSNDELKHVLEYRWNELSLPLSYEDFEDYESINTVIKITNGNFRLVQRLFSQIIRIMEINELNKINVEVIETARDGLLIGENE
ncbi:AAA family ATPase [Staphylococcus capitis]|uniref:AAA family ATPase n=1 Tax=Staphylococcus capitis TaxID=29388 RepID=UPI001F57744F|nr:AAA family ATPase [Staphylococcus capitis]MCI2953384.1 AAA family ATPase [Staphylococcus capitis]MDS3981778.1 AAA family ATPase [Staphylococcus capitis]